LPCHVMIKAPNNSDSPRDTLINRQAQQSARSATLTAVLFMALVPLYACGGDPTSLVGKAQVLVNFGPAENGSFTAQLNGQTFKSAGWFPMNQSSSGSTYEITGSFTGSSMRIRFSTSTAAGVQSGSVLSLQGPGPVVSDCELTYVPTTSGSHQFRVQFKVTGTIGLVCP
jgi:hypothetical protein